MSGDVFWGIYPGGNIRIPLKAIAIDNRRCQPTLDAALTAGRKD